MIKNYYIYISNLDLDSFNDKEMFERCIHISFHRDPPPRRHPAFVLITLSTQAEKLYILLSEFVNCLDLDVYFKYTDK